MSNSLLFLETLKNLELNLRVNFEESYQAKPYKMKARGVRSILSLALLTILVKSYRCQKPLEGSGKNANELLEENLASLESTFGGELSMIYL